MKTMSAEQYLLEGKLALSLDHLQKQIRENPASPKHRVFLFQLLTVLGQWERSLNQLKVASDLDATNLLMAQTYREAVLCEAFRTEVLAGKRTPLIFGEPQPWVVFLVEALRLDAEGHLQEAKHMRDKSLATADVVSGKIDGVDFNWIADADSRLGPVLEVIVNGRYYWIPFQQISNIQIEEPKDLRDVVWMPAQFTWINGGSSSGLIPTRYPGSENSEDSTIKLSRKTEWEEIYEGTFKGFGQRLLTTDVDEYALMDVRLIEFKSMEE